jgi:hypothetical protein
MPSTLAPIIAEAPQDKDVEEGDDETPEMIATRVKQAQL